LRPGGNIRPVFFAPQKPPESAGRSANRSGGFALPQDGTSGRRINKK